MLSVIYMSCRLKINFLICYLILIAQQSLETMSLREIGPQLKLPINVTKGSMPLPCNIYFPKILAIKSIRKHITFSLPPLMKVLTDFHLIPFR